MTKPPFQRRKRYPTSRDNIARVVRLRATEEVMRIRGRTNLMKTRT